MPFPDCNGLTATGLVIVQMGQPQYQQPVNVYVAPPEIEASRPYSYTSNAVCGSLANELYIFHDQGEIDTSLAASKAE